MDIERWWNDNYRKKTGLLERETVAVTFCPRKIPYGLACGKTRVAAVEGRKLTAYPTGDPNVVYSKFSPSAEVKFLYIEICSETKPCAPLSDTFAIFP